MLQQFFFSCTSVVLSKNVSLSGFKLAMLWLIVSGSFVTLSSSIKQLIILTPTQHFSFIDFKTLAQLYPRFTQGKSQGKQGQHWTFERTQQFGWQKDDGYYLFFSSGAGKGLN